MLNVNFVAILDTPVLVIVLLLTGINAIQKDRNSRKDIQPNKKYLASIPGSDDSLIIYLLIFHNLSILAAILARPYISLIGPAMAIAILGTLYGIVVVQIRNFIVPGNTPREQASRLKSSFVHAASTTTLLLLGCLRYFNPLSGWYHDDFSRYSIGLYSCVLIILSMPAYFFGAQHYLRQARKMTGILPSSIPILFHALFSMASIYLLLTIVSALGSVDDSGFDFWMTRAMFRVWLPLLFITPITWLKLKTPLPFESR